MKKLLVLIVLLLTVPSYAETTEKERKACTYECIKGQVDWNEMCREKYKGFWDIMACGEKYKVVLDKCLRDCGCNPDRAGYGDMCK
jgi:hypothetical protein